MGLRVCSSDRLPGDTDVLGTWTALSREAVEGAAGLGGGVWRKCLEMSSALCYQAEGSDGSVIMLSRRMAADGEEIGAWGKGVQ